VVNTGRGWRLTELRDLQIVNGGQTTASLYNARVKDSAKLDGVFVQMKLSILTAEDSAVLIPEISRYANTQNRVSEADLFANHPFHRAVEELSRRIWAPARAGMQQMTHWFYERARAQYQSELAKLKPSDRKRFELQSPSLQKIEKTDLALYENTFRLLPHIVSLGAQKNFLQYAEHVSSEFEAHPSEFNDRWFQHLIAKAIVFQELERLVSGASWYKGGYRRNIVTYAIARWLFAITEQRKGFVVDLDKIWRAQAISDQFATQLLSCAETVSSVISNPPPPWTNVTEWAKKEACWLAISRAPVALVAELRRDLKPSSEERTDRRDARERASDDEAIGAMVQAIKELEAGTLQRALDWPRAHRVLTETERGIFRTAVSRRGWSPSDAQARRVVAALARLREEGFH
jgi:hypothetical protein